MADEPQPDNADRFARLIRGLREGNEQIVGEFCATYGDALHRLADKNLSKGLRQRVEPEDVVQSACRTFLRRARGGEFTLGDGGELWRLMCAITLTKVREQSRFHLRQRRSPAREVSPSVEGDSSSGPSPADAAPSPADAAEFAEQFQLILSRLDEEQRRVVDLKLQEYSNEQIGERLGCSERTIRRLMNQIKAQISLHIRG